MFSSKFHAQPIGEISEAVYLGITIEPFQVDRKAAGLSPHTLKLYRQFHDALPRLLRCQRSESRVEEVTPDALRRYFRGFAERQNLGGVHTSFQALRAFFPWLVDEEMMPAEIKNPVLKVEPPKMALEPVANQDVNALITACTSSTVIDDRDRAIQILRISVGARWTMGYDAHLT